MYNSRSRRASLLTIQLFNGNEIRHGIGFIVKCMKKVYYRFCTCKKKRGEGKRGGRGRDIRKEEGM